MQPHAPPRRKSSAGLIFAVLLVVGFLMVGGLILAVAGAFVFARAESRQVQAIAQREMARSHAEVARVELEARRDLTRAQEQLERANSWPRAVAETPVAKPIKQPIQVANREITLLLDGQGQIKMDGKSVDGKQLKTLLRNAGKGRESAISVTIKADKKCVFAHVATVLSVCQELDVPNVRITAAD